MPDLSELIAHALNAEPLLVEAVQRHAGALCEALHSLHQHNAKMIYRDGVNAVGPERDKPPVLDWAARLTDALGRARGVVGSPSNRRPGQA